MPRTQHSIFAPEGRLLIVLSILLGIMLHSLLGLNVTPYWLLVLGLMWILRDPRCVVPSAPLGIISPVKGRVIGIAETHDPYLQREALRISLRMTFTGVYSLRSITEGKVMQHWYNQPREQAYGYDHSVWIQTDEQDDVVLAIYPGRLFGRIACYISTGDRVGQGQRCGFIPLGAKLDIFLPANSQLVVEVGDRVTAGETILAQLLHD